MKRLFTIGCSYTNYNWPTWADWLGSEYDEYYNLGRAGKGNRYIGSTLGNVLPKFKPTKNDTVIIQWGSILRDDYFTKDGYWSGGIGNMYNQYFLPMEDVYKEFRPCQIAYETIGYINFTRSFLNNSECSWMMFWLLNPLIEDFLGEPFRACFKDKVDSIESKQAYELLQENAYTLTKDFLQTDLSIFQLDYLDPTMYHNGHVDSHPSSQAHLEYAKYIVTNMNKKDVRLDKHDNLAKEWDNYKSNEKITDDINFQPPYPSIRNDSSKWMQ